MVGFIFLLYFMAGWLLIDFTINLKSKNPNPHYVRIANGLKNHRNKKISEKKVIH